MEKDRVLLVASPARTAIPDSQECAHARSVLREMAQEQASRDHRDRACRNCPVVVSREFSGWENRTKVISMLVPATFSKLKSYGRSVSLFDRSALRTGVTTYISFFLFLGWFISCSPLSAHSQNVSDDESGTLVMVARTNTAVIVSVDSAVHALGPNSLEIPGMADGGRKLISVGKNGACAIDGTWVYTIKKNQMCLDFFAHG
jgi:hypothetical protein